jgi:hypothetical protein
MNEQNPTNDIAMPSQEETEQNKTDTKSRVSTSYTSQAARKKE